MTKCAGHAGREVRIRWSPRPDGLEESVQFTPGYNCADRGMLSHGVHGMEVRWLLRGPAGAVHFVAYTDWIPGRLSPGHGLSPAGSYTWSYDGDGEINYPNGSDLGYHARRPQFEGHDGGGQCCWIDAPCWYDGTAIGAHELGKRFRNSARGEHEIWDELERWYQRLHDGEELAGIEAIS